MNLTPHQKVLLEFKNDWRKCALIEDSRMLEEDGRIFYYIFIENYWEHSRPEELRGKENWDKKIIPSIFFRKMPIGLADHFLMFDVDGGVMFILDEIRMRYAIIEGLNDLLNLENKLEAIHGAH